MIEIITFTMYLITSTDIQTADVEVQRLDLDNHAECLALATAINQVRDPISMKKNCRSVKTYYLYVPSRTI